MVRANVPHVISDDSALGGQLIGGSLRFNRVSSSVGTYLSRTPSSAGNQKTYTVSVWVKRSSIGSTHPIFNRYTDNNESGFLGLYLNSDNNIYFTGWSTVYLKTNRLYRDTNAWSHIVLAVDTTQASSSNRIKLYFNGELQTFVTYNAPSQNADLVINANGAEHRIGNYSTNYFDGQMTEMHFIDGQALDSSYFGYTDFQTGIWRPKRYEGTYGTNGFYLPMDGTSHVGKDMSGNGNDYTPIKCGTVPVNKATGAFPIINTNNGATIPLPGFRPDPFASSLILASTFSDPSDVLDVHHLIKGSGSEKGLFVTGTTKEVSHRNFYGRSGSLLFNGSSDYIRVNDSADWVYGSGDFCIECWVRPTNLSGSRRIISHTEEDGTPDSSWIFRTDGDKFNFYFQCNGSSSRIYLNNGVRSLSTNEWYHLAATRQGSTFRTFINGEIDQTATFSGTMPDIGDQIQIGRRANGSEFWSGYMQDLRVYIGVAKYTEEFLCGAVDSSIVQDSPSGISISRKLDSNTGGSVALHITPNVSPDIIIASNSDLSLNGDFTIEFWIYLNSIAQDTHNQSIITFPDNSGIGQVYINAGNKYYSLYNSNGGDIGRSAYKSAKTGRWQYITITRSSNSVRLFIDGVLSGDATNSQTFGNAYGGIRIGGYTQDTGNIDGHISNLRIIKGTALYTSSFTPPTEPLTNVSGTSLLCFQSATDVEDFTVDKNASTLNNKNWTRSGTFAWSIGADSSVNSKWRQFDGTIETGSAGAPNGNPGNVRFTFDSPITGITKCRIRANTHNDTYQYRRTYYNGANGTYSIQTGSNTTTWHDVTSNVGNTLNWVEWGSYGGADADRGPYGCNGIEINDVLLTDRFRDNDGHGDKSSASHFSPFDNHIIQEGLSQYATLNANAHTGVTLSNGSLTNTGGNDIPANMGVKTGKFYVEVRIDTAYGSPNIKHLGLCATGTRTFRANAGDGHIIGYLDTVFLRSDAAGPYTYTGRGAITSWTQVFNDSNQIYTLGDTVGIQLDMDNKFVKIYINGSLRVHYTFVLASTFDKMYFFGRNNGSGKTTWNFGQKPYEFTPPPGFLPLASHNLESSSILKPQRFFDILTYTGDDASVRAITGLEFKPDLVWIKTRSTASTSHGMINSVCEDGSGNKTMLYPNDNAAETVGGSYFALYTATGLQPFIDNGFRINNNTSGNGSGRTFVAWCWKAGGDSNTFNIDDVGYATAAAAGLNGGTANPTGASVNTKAGFSIISYTATNNQNVSYSHGLNQAPEIIIVKDRDNSRNWGVYYNILGTNTNWLKLDDTDAQGNNNSSVTPVGGTSNTYMHLHQDYFAPSYNAFANGGNDGNDKLIAYMWHSVPGYSKFGSYMGNGNANGPYIDCGFRPALVIAKRITNTDNWLMKDSTRNTYNSVFSNLNPNTNNAEFGSSDDTNSFDFYSNGFKVKGTNGAVNADGDSFIFMAWAEQPEVTPFGSQSNAR